MVTQNDEIIYFDFFPVQVPPVLPLWEEDEEGKHPEVM